MALLVFEYLTNLGQSLWIEWLLASHHSAAFCRDKPFDVVVGTGNSYGMQMDIDFLNPLFVAVPSKVNVCTTARQH